MWGRMAIRSSRTRRGGPAWPPVLTMRCRGGIHPALFLPVTLSPSKGLTDRIVPSIHGRSNFGRRAGVKAHDERPHTNGADRGSHIPHPGAESDLGYGLGATLWGYDETPQSAGDTQSP